MKIATRSIFLLALFSFILACNTGDEPAAVPFESDGNTAPPCTDLHDILTNGKLVALTDNSSTSYFIYKGLPMGFEFELLQQYCDHIGVDLELIVVQDLDQIFDSLLVGRGHVVAANMTVTGDRAQQVNFTSPLLKARQVLVQRIPASAPELSPKELKNSMVGSQEELIGKQVHVRRNSSFYSRLQALSDEIGGPIEIIEAAGDVETEALIRQVSQGIIPYTVADEHVARLNQKYYPNIDVSVPISFHQKIAWAVRPDCDSLLASLNQWIDSARHTNDYATIYTKYFKARTQQKKRATSALSSISGSQISEFDSTIKFHSKVLDWDWRLLAAVISQESGFDPEAESWTGAAGLMQVLPSTADTYGVSNLSDPDQNLKAGTQYLAYLDEYWAEKIEDQQERTKFVLASYNVGLGHVLDARSLASKYDANPAVWDDNVAEYIAKKSETEYYQDEVCKHGYCRGSETKAYVKRVMQRFDHYKNAFE